MIYVFYSYKGGVGRTLTLAHVGIKLAAMRRTKPYKVLLVDMDLEAPGLEIYFKRSSRQELPGFAGLLTGYRQANIHRIDWLRSNIDKPTFISKVTGTDNLYIMPAGIKAHTSQGRSYQEINQMLREEMPPSGVPELPKEGFFHDLREVLREKFTYVLVDSRTGLADQAYASTLLLSDILVLCLRLNRANVEGVQKVFGNFLMREQKRVGDRDVKMIAVATPVPPHGDPKIEHWISLTREALGHAPDASHSQSPPVEEALFPVVHRMFFEPQIEVGEELIFRPNGSLRKGFSEETPIFGAIGRLAEHIASLNADGNVKSAEALEIRLYEEKGEYLRALDYLFKQIRLEPLEETHWGDLVVGYARRNVVRQQAEELLGDLIKEWRAALPSNNACAQPEKAKRLAWAIHTWVRGYGKDMVDAGYSKLEEALKLCCGDRTLRCECHHLMGQVIDEIVKERKAAQFTLESRVRRHMTLEEANAHYTEAIKVSRQLGERACHALLLRARNLRELGRYQQALGDFDRLIAGTAPKRATDIDTASVAPLLEQAQLLEFLGYHDIAFSNYRTALNTKSPDTKLLQASYRCARRLELHDFARQLAIRWEREESATQKATVHRQVAVNLMLECKYEAALEESKIANAYAARRRMGALDAFIYLAWGKPEEACKILPAIIDADDSTYNRALYAIALKWAGRHVKDGLMRKGANSDHLTSCIAALVCHESMLAVQILSTVNQTELHAEEFALFLALRTFTMTSDDQASQSTFDRLLKLIESPHFFAVAFRNLPEALLFKRACDHLQVEGRLGKSAMVSHRVLWKKVNSAKPPKLDKLPPRRFREKVSARLSKDLIRRS